MASNTTHSNAAPAKHKKLKRVMMALAVILVLLGIASWWAYENRLVLYHWWYGDVTIDRNKYPIVGIDVSSHNGDIDFNKVKSEGYSFVIIKASEGIDHLDSKFAHNYDCAKANGLKVGAYHFFRKNTDGLNQAKNFLEAVGWRKFDLPLVIDVEDWNNDAVNDDVTQRHFDAMVDNLRSRGYQVMIYTNGNGYKKYVKDGQVNVNLWLCSFKDPDELKDIPHQLQQYSHWGRVKGMWGDVDLNVFNGSAKQWEQWLQGIASAQVAIPVDTAVVANDVLPEEKLPSQ